MVTFLEYLFEWRDYLVASIPFLIAIRREWKVLDGTVESAKAALLLPHDDPSREQMARMIDARQRRAFGTIRIAMLAILVILYCLAPR